MQYVAPDQELLPSIRVLLVDDQEDILHVMQLILMRQQDYCVETAMSGRQALEKAETFAPDVIVSDIAMPEMDGYELMTQLRSKTELNPFKSIALSGYGGDQQRVSLEAGYDAHLVKPVDYEELAQVIQQLAQEKVGVSE